MKIIQRYVLKELTGPFFMGLFIFTFLLLANKFFRLIDLFIVQGVSPSIMANLFFCLMTTLFSLTVPMAVLVSVLIGLGRLSVDRELLAIRINGISLLRVFTPIIVVAALFSAIMLIANFTLIPRLMLRVSDLLYKLQFNLVTSLEPNRFYDNLGGGDLDITLYFAAKSKKDQSLQKIQLKVSKKITERQIDEKGNTYIVKKKQEMLIMANKGRIIPNEAEKSISIYLYNGTIIPLNEEDKPEEMIIQFAELHRTLYPELSRFKGGHYQKRPREMTLSELMEGMQKYRMSERKKDKKRLGKLRQEFFQRLSIPLSCIAFVLIGIPLALIVRPSGKSAGFALSFALLFIYFVLLKWGSALVETGYSYSWLAVFSPNILLGLIGGVMIYLVVRK
ncbi:LptF/LptG family permease [Candidatus Sumerlaeota bacterium]|nr:LptF/LptG family permease [Candidatus Sumerlaeota bacterium]